MNTSIMAQDIRKSFGVGRKKEHKKTEVLKGISLSIHPGEMLAIVGPSGSGKSTLLYCLSGLELTDSGSIEIMGKQIVRAGRNSLSKIRSNYLGFIFQSYNLIPSLNVGENVSLPARLAGRPISSAHMHEVLMSVGLGGREKDRPSDMSGGEQQRVAIARVLANNPAIVFADEPTGALDSQNGSEVLQMLRKIGDDPKRSVVMVTHDLEAASLADRILVLRDGRIIKEMGYSTASQILEALGEAQ